MTTYVYHAVLDTKWESDMDFGLFHNKADAKKACQDEQGDTVIVWDNSDRNRAHGSVAVFSDGSGPLRGVQSDNHIHVTDTTFRLGSYPVKTLDR